MVQMDRVETFNEHRTLLFSIAYRMTGSVMDAEDMVQEAFLRWQDAPADEVRSPKAYLSTVVTRLCIDEMRSARSRREQYVGPWLPEPLISEDFPPPDEDAARADSLSMAFLVLLETLTPTERAAFLLREVFDYPYGEIAEILGTSEANCRQLVHRARAHVRERRPRFDASRDEARRLTERFLAAAVQGEMSGLLDLLADDVVLWSDGGGKVAAALNPIRGARNVARFFAGIAGKAPAGLATRFALINGRPGVITYVDGRPQSAAEAEIEGGKVRSIRIVVNPDKLRNVPPLEQ